MDEVLQRWGDRRGRRLSEAESSVEWWVSLSAAPLQEPVARAFLDDPRCGAVVVFTGTARDHSVGREQVSRLEFEAYETVAVDRLAGLAVETLSRTPEVRRLVMAHRVGVVAIGEPAVVVGASSGHRDAAFEAARFGIDALKATIPIWKRETWSGGESFGLEAQHLVDPARFAVGDGAVDPALGPVVGTPSVHST